MDIPELLPLMVLAIQDFKYFILSKLVVLVEKISQRIHLDLTVVTLA
jgi:hypothetical protein